MSSRPLSEHEALISDLMTEIEAEMRRLDLWEVVPPSVEALASEQPFCFDTLALHQWLQWIFLPRMRALLEGRLPLPGQCDIHPLAEYRFRELPQETARLEALILSMDRAISDA